LLFIFFSCRKRIAEEADKPAFSVQLKGSGAFEDPEAKKM